MSIIHEALKKAQNNLKESSPATVDHPPQTQQQAHPSAPQTSPLQKNSGHAKTFAPSSPKYVTPHIQKKAEHPSTPEESSAPQSFFKILPLNKIILAVVLLILLAAAKPFLTNHSTKTTTPTPETATAPTANAPVVAQNSPQTNAVAVNPLTVTTPTQASTPVFRPQLILNGISQAGEKPLALINNEIYETGQEIYGLMILSISESGVELLDGDQKIFLKKR